MKIRKKVRKKRERASKANIRVNKEFKEFELAFQDGKNPPNKLNYIKENIVNNFKLKGLISLYKISTN